MARTQAERSTIALYLYHPELKTVWGDLEADIPVIKPKRAPQPKELKAILLPFQQVVFTNLALACLSNGL
jgi:DNA repair protein RAD16